MTVPEIVVCSFGTLIALATLLAAIGTVVVPRPERSLMVRFVFLGMRLLFLTLARRRRTYEAKDALLARYAPTSLMVLPVVWAAGVIYGFSLMYWSLGVRPYRQSVVVSGSSLTTLGIHETQDLPTLFLAVIEGLIGLGIVALMISFLPTMYSAFSSRESTVVQLETRAGRPPLPETMIILSHRTGGLESMEKTWGEWEQWFIRVEESHETYPALVFFRSLRSDRSWVVSAGAILDTAAISLSAVEAPPSAAAAYMIRSGYLTFRTISDYFGIRYDPDPSPTDPISVHRHEFDEVYDTLKGAGVPVVENRDQAWADYAGWRVNYDACLVALAHLTSAPYGKWSSDRPPPKRRPSLFVRPKNAPGPPLLRQLLRRTAEYKAKRQ